ncbi:DUF2840 domain-containing protein [Pseudorhodoplanes sp.]|uniref:DUF2840 domain-containing protein n=1 Tax=Pseudorhodoplanes sp. TaxID=1934341 RepID=UPI002CD486DC|nr:DUF2840 domain-containing protein [Pseudorhodoplanes sp.]HWV51708.1 DUF2840 domain-containing protein [Pseudorhodoplanes sp.]
MREGSAIAADVAGMLTHVELIWRTKQIEHRLRFGRPAATLRLGTERRRVSFAPGAVFAVLRWRGNEYGTIASRLDILRAVGCGESFTTVPDVAPGAAILLSLTTWPKVERALHAIDAVDALGLDPADVALDYWLHVHNRLSVGEVPRRYTRTRHQAWLKRRRIAP